MREKFIEWVRDNYQGFEAEEVLNHYVQSGDFPQDFIDEMKGDNNV